MTAISSRGAAQQERTKKLDDSPRALSESESELLWLESILLSVIMEWVWAPTAIIIFHIKLITQTLALSLGGEFARASPVNGCGGIFHIHFKRRLEFWVLLSLPVGVCSTRDESKSERETFPNAISATAAGQFHCFKWIMFWNRVLTRLVGGDVCALIWVQHADYSHSLLNADLTTCNQIEPTTSIFLSHFYFIVIILDMWVEWDFILFYVGYNIACGRLAYRPLSN